MKDNTIKKSNRERIFDKTVTILKMNYGNDIMNSTIVMIAGNNANSINVQASQFRDISAKDSIIKYIVRSYAVDNEVTKVIVIMASDVIDYVNKYSIDTSKYISIDLDRFSELGYDVNNIDPNFVDISVKAKLVDANNTEYYDESNESNYISGFIKVNGQLLSVKVNSKTNNVVIFWGGVNHES